MTKKEFLKILEHELIKKNIKDVKDIISYYDDIIDGKIELGLKEENVVNSLVISEIINDLLSEESSPKKFTYSDFIGERKNNFTNGKPISRSKENIHYVSRLPIHDTYSLRINTWDRNVNITSAPIDHLFIKYKQKFLKPIEMYQDGNTVSVIERKKHIWLISLFNVTIFSLLFYLLYLLFKPLADDNWTWYFLITGLAILSYSILYLPHYFNQRKKDAVLEILIPTNFPINILDIISSDSKTTLENVVTNTLNAKILTGKLFVYNTYFKNSTLKVSSGKALLDGSSNKDKHMITSLNILISSGNLTINDLNLAQLKGTVSSGSLLVENISTDNFKVNVSSGNIKGNALYVKNTLESKVSSGGFNVSDIFFSNLEMKVSSGSVNLNEIHGSDLDYLINAKTSSGSVRVNGVKLDTYGYKIVTEMPNKKINVSAFSGRIKLNFKDTNNKSY